MKTKTTAILAMSILAMVAASGCITGSEVTGNVVEGDVSGSKAGFFSVPLTDITETASFYAFDADGIEVRFFAVRGDDGEIHTAFDACDVCGGDKGYRQEAGDMVCNNCGRHFRVDGIGTENLGGGCWPTFLRHTIEGDQLLFAESDLKAGRTMF